MCVAVSGAMLSACNILRMNQAVSAGLPSGGMERGEEGVGRESPLEG